MDPYKVLGVSAHKIKGPADLQPVRRRAKQLFRRYAKDKKKFDAKKVLEAFEAIKQRLKNRPGEGVYKIIGRSRKERELDKHFNHQTKEIRKDKRVRRELRRARKGEKRFHLPGDKEKVARPRARRRRRKLKPQNIDVVQGLQRLAPALLQQHKFPKAIKLLRRWMKEYMNQDNRGYIFEVLQQVVECDFITEDSDSRQDIIGIF